MNPFQSDNIWKKKARQGKAQQHPLTPQQEWQKQVNSSSLWLGGGVVLLALYLAAVRAGTVALDASAVVLIVVVGCFCVYTAASLGRLMKNKPEEAPATFEAREARTRGCSPLVTPKLLGSIQKIQVAALKDFLCCADFKAPQPLRRQLPAGERGLNITFALSAARMLPQGASAGNTPLTATTPSREKANKPAPQGWLVCNI